MSLYSKKGWLRAFAIAASSGCSSAKTAAWSARTHRYGVENILFVLDEAPNVQALAIPRYRLHPLKGEFKGYWSVTVKANWWIIFRFEEGYAYGVELIDYH